jgi:hypothetical protein
VQPISTTPTQRKTTEDVLETAPDRHEAPHSILLAPQISVGK